MTVVPASPYYDWATRRPIDPVRDGCPFSEWPALHGERRVAVHPGGFLVFLPPSDLPAADEYAGTDPYRVEENLEGDFQQRRIRLTLDLARQALPSGRAARVLDLGCGKGTITARIHETFPEAEVFGLDRSLTAIRDAAARFPDLRLAVADARTPPYREGFFDLVVCNNLWEHVPDPLVVLEGVGRVLSPGGYLIVSTPSRYRIGNLLRVVRGRPVSLMSRFHVTEYTVGQVVEQLAHGGFEVERITSSPIAPPRKGLRAALTYRALLPVLATLLRLLGSRHCLESTVFYLARKKA